MPSCGQLISKMPPSSRFSFGSESGRKDAGGLENPVKGRWHYDISLMQHRLQNQLGFDRLGAFPIHCFSSISCNSHAAILLRLRNMQSVPSPSILALTSLASPLLRFGTLYNNQHIDQTASHHIGTNLNSVHAISGGSPTVALLKPLISS